MRGASAAEWPAPLKDVFSQLFNTVTTNRSCAARLYSELLSLKSDLDDSYRSVLFRAVNPVAVAKHY
nr:hypothetical protein AgrTiEU6_169 [Agrobacterium tumefaciens]ASK44133.1 hypothetical protein [Agrobacterium fabrum]ASK44232.1 hypothetical protein [Rhizobium rhizogenes]ASK47409.1 hypothetical protein [Agrobacterium tomkonis]ASK47699.1 hypothetical protein [Agrobacterium radiobacter]ASK48047.1 hypothetical protein [Agrobacterium deltaense]